MFRRGVPGELQRWARQLRTIIRIVAPDVLPTRRVFAEALKLRLSVGGWRRDRRVSGVCQISRV